MSESSAESAELVSYDFGAFEPYLNLHGTTARVLEWAMQTEKKYPDGRAAGGKSEPPVPVVILEEHSLLFGFVLVGLELEKGESSAVWLVEWLEGRGGLAEDLLGNARSRSLDGPTWRDSVEVIPSELVLSRVLPAAVAAARQTIGRDGADARHLLWALAQETGQNSDAAWHDVFAAEGLRSFNEYMLERLQRSHEKVENLEAWSSLLAAPKPTETVGTLSDAPALVDALGRQAFAEVLGTRVKQVSETLRSGTLGNDSAFILHVDGPWGSGKSSILNFLKTNLEQSDPQWLIVEFNAWRNQQRSPAWWPIISHVWGAVHRESPLKFKMARWVWLRWTIRMRWIPVALSLVLTAVLLYFAWQAVAGHTEGVAGAVKDIGAAVLALATLAGLALTTSRTIFFGSKNAAEAYVQSTVEPYRPIVRLYERLIGAIGCPVAVFIDDIDRCEGNYVIELLEGIQTLLRSAPVVYVVAGDRKWICSSFEKRYADFGGQIGMPGRPLGYLFLDKVFQLSTAIPRLSTVRQADYWKRLLETGEGARSTPQDVKQLEAEAEKELEGKTSHEEIQAQIDRTEEGSIERETIRAAAAKQTTSREAMRAAEHRLQPLSHLLEPNPRSMKRLVNAYGLNQARAFLEGRTVEVEALARWTIVELRWPILADYLASNWSDIADHSLSVAQFPEGIRALLGDSDVKQVFGDEGDGMPLTLATLGPILE